MAFHGKNQTNPLVIDVTGYTPYSMARLHRLQTSKSDAQARSRDAAIRDYWIRCKLQKDAEDYVVQHNKDLFRSRWECATDKKGLYSRVKWEMNKVYEKRKQDLEQRRNRLSDMLRKEGELYLHETSMPQETPQERKMKMFNRYDKLCMEKEKERKEIVKKKTDLQFRSNCDELRELMSRKIHDQIYIEGQEMGQIKDVVSDEKNKDDRMFAEMWIRDAQAKDQKEKEESEMKIVRNMEYKNHVLDQIESKELNKLKDAEIKEEEAQLLIEQRKVMEIEKAWLAAQKKQKQERVKKGLDKCVRNNLKKQTKEVQEDLMLDLYFLKQLSGDEDHNVKEMEKKKAVYQEQQEYLKHLSDQIKKEAEFERNLDKMYQEELDKMWDKREQEWAADKKRQEDFNKKILHLRYEQIQQTLERNKQVQNMRSVYGKEVHKQSAKDVQEDLEKMKRIREKNCRHQKELLQQIKEKKEEATHRAMENKMEYEAFKKKEEELDKKMKDIMADTEISNIHPYRTRKFNIADEKI